MADFNNIIPIQEFKKKKVWINWDALNDNGKIRKVPKNPKTGENAKTNDSDTWTDYKTASENKYGFTGVGYCFVKIDETYVLVGIDIDGHRDGNNDKADEIINLFRDTYIERSPSGTGYHILMLARSDSLPASDEYKTKFRQKNDEIEVECYIAGMTNRYFTYTGDVVSESDNIFDMTDTLLSFLDTYMLKPIKTDKPIKSSPSSGTINTVGCTDVPPNWIDYAVKAKNGSGAKFEALYYKRDLTKYNGDESKADMALCRLLAYWLQGDAVAIDTEFRKSALYRDKWERADYRNNTIDKAIKCCNGSYANYKAVNLSSPDTNPQKENKEYFQYNDFLEWCKDNGVIIVTDIITHKWTIKGLDTDLKSKTDKVNTLPRYIIDAVEDTYKGVSKDRIEDYIYRLATNNPVNPILDAINNAKAYNLSYDAENGTNNYPYDGWDGIDRLEEIYDIWQISPDDTLSRCFIQKWFMQCYCSLFKTLDETWANDIVLVFRGNQRIGKTRFFQRISLIDLYFGEGMSIDPSNKDSVCEATSKIITEMGEIGSTMRRDINILKAFISKPRDEYRPPYGRSSVLYPRITSFVGTANETDFLVDPTGNGRFAVVNIDDNVSVSIERLKNLNVMQLWLQIGYIVNQLILQGYTYANCFRFTPEEKQQLEIRNKQFIRQGKGETEVADVLAKLEKIAEDDNVDGKVVYEWMTVQEFKYDNDELKYLDNGQIGKILVKLGFMQERKKSSRLYYLPKIVGVSYTPKSTWNNCGITLQSSSPEIPFTEIIEEI